MEPDRFRVADTRGWFAAADTDFRSAEADLLVSPPVLEDVLFHCQQAVEKALKGFPTWNDHPFQKTHDLGELAHLFVKSDATLEPILRPAAPLSKYASGFRYPGAPYKPTLEEAENAFKLAREVVAEILARLPPEVGL